MTFGIIDIREGFEDCVIVRCNNCYAYYYDEPGDSRDESLLQIVWEEDNKEFVKGCGNCRTDSYLTDIEGDYLVEMQKTFVPLDEDAIFPQPGQNRER